VGVTSLHDVQGGFAVRRVKSAGFWFGIAGALAVAVVFVDGPAGGALAVAAFAAVFVGCFRGLAGKKVDDRAAGSGWFGGWF
jgi:hypothetical protein